MNELTVFEKNGNLWTDSRDVAEMVDKQHKNLLRDIESYINEMEGLGNLKVEPSSFFTPSTYTSEQNKQLPCYLISKKGCEFIANKLTGAKGTQFTALYVTRFNDMEQRQRPACIEDVLIQSLQEMKQVKIQLAAVSDRVDGIRDVIALSPNAWREDCRRMLASIAQARGGAYQETNAEIYRLVDERAGVSLETRLTNKRRRLMDEGVCKSKRDKLSKVDVIADDKKLIEIYLAVVKEMAVKEGITVSDRKAS